MQCASNPIPIGVGYLCQYLIKPMLGFIIAKASCDPRYPTSADPAALIWLRITIVRLFCILSGSLKSSDPYFCYCVYQDSNVYLTLNIVIGKVLVLGLTHSWVLMASMHGWPVL